MNSQIPYLEQPMLQGKPSPRFPAISKFADLLVEKLHKGIGNKAGDFHFANAKRRLGRAGKARCAGNSRAFILHMGKLEGICAKIKDAEKIGYLHQELGKEYLKFYKAKFNSFIDPFRILKKAIRHLESALEYQGQIAGNADQAGVKKDKFTEASLFLAYAYCRSKEHGKILPILEKCGELDRAARLCAYLLSSSPVLPAEEKHKLAESFFSYMKQLAKEDAHNPKRAAVRYLGFIPACPRGGNDDEYKLFLSDSGFSIGIKDKELELRLCELAEPFIARMKDQQKMEDLQGILELRYNSYREFPEGSKAREKMFNSFIGHAKKVSLIDPGKLNIGIWFSFDAEKIRQIPDGITESNFDIDSVKLVDKGKKA